MRLGSVVYTAPWPRAAQDNAQGEHPSLHSHRPRISSPRAAMVATMLRRLVFCSAAASVLAACDDPAACAAEAPEDAFSALQVHGGSCPEKNMYCKNLCKTVSFVR